MLYCLQRMYSMTIRKRLARSNPVMILIPVAIAAALLLAGGGLAVLLLKRVYLPPAGKALKIARLFG